jgi:hypothetical protein
MLTATQARIALPEDILSYVRVSILGNLFSEEVWSINPVFDPSFEFPGGVDQTALDAATLAIANRTVPTSLRAAMSGVASRTGARCEVRDDATDALIGISTQGSATPTAGTGGNFLTPQSAVVFSIRTNTPGGSGRGRVYWPAMGVTLTTAGRISAPSTSTMAADMKSYLLGMRSDLAAAFPTIGFDLAVRSKTTHTTPHAVRLQVGNIVDTQRRRRDNLPESYVQVAFP